MKLRYFLFLNQGGGCDYTIACGEKLVSLEAETMEQAKEEVKEKLEYYGFDRLESAELIVGHIADMSHVIQELKQEEEQAERESQLDEKRKQLAKLKKELGEA